MPSTQLLSIRTFAVLAEDIKLAHSVFALPFALLAAFMAAAPVDAALNWNRFSGQVALVLAAMVFARTAAMLANRWLDRNIDAANPRTAGRAIPAGRLSAPVAAGAWVVSAISFTAVCAGFGLLYGNWWPLALAGPVIVWISAYGLLKRFTAWCHVYLGSSLAVSPLAAAIAIDPTSLAAQPALWLLAVMVLFWVAGFDVLYALQDVDVDRRQGLYSLPARMGAATAVRLSRLMHGLAGGALIVAAVVDPRLMWLFGLGVVSVFALLCWEHLTILRWGTDRITLAFFTLNGVISLLLGTLGIADVLLGT